MSSPSLPLRQRPVQQREQLDLFRALPGDMAPRDSQDLMAFPFFSLAKSRRTAPIDFRASGITIRVEGTVEHGIATIWEAVFADVGVTVIAVFNAMRVLKTEKV